MDQDTFQKLARMMQSENDADAVMGLRGLQALFKAEHVDFGRALSFLMENLSALKEKPRVTMENIVQKPEEKSALEVSGMPQCQAPQPGVLMIVPPGQAQGAPVQLPGVAAEFSKEIADHLKDALVAAVINKSRFKLKLLDVKDKRGDIVETILQAEYDREGMMPVPIWSNVKGEVAALASVLRRAVANSMPEMVA